MSLDFKLGDIANWEKLCENPHDPKKLSPVTNALIWKCMTLGMRSITADNVNEFYWRLRWHQRLDGPDFRWTDDTSAYLTLQDVKDHIGLSTNVTQQTRKQWLKRHETEEHPPISQHQSATEVFINRAEIERGENPVKNNAEA